MAFEHWHKAWYTVARVNTETGSRRYSPWFWGTYWDAHRQAFAGSNIASPTRFEILRWDGRRAVDAAGVTDAGAPPARPALSVPAFIAQAARPPGETAGVGDWWQRFSRGWGRNWWRR